MLKLVRAHYGLRTKRDTRPMRNPIRKKVNKIQKQVTALNSSTLRQKATNSGATVVTQAGQFSLLNGMQVGDGDGTRGGNRIVTKYIECRCSITFDASSLAATTAQAYYYRMIIFWWRSPSGASPSVQDFLLNTGSNANNYLSPVDLNSKSTFKIIYDKTIVLKPSANTRQAVGDTTYENDPKIIIFKKGYKNGVKTVYDNGNVGDITDLNFNALYMYETSNSTVDVQSSNRSVIRYLE